MCLGKAELALDLALWLQACDCLLQWGHLRHGQGLEAHLAPFISSVAVGQAEASPVLQGQLRVPGERWFCVWPLQPI